MNNECGLEFEAVWGRINVLFEEVAGLRKDLEGLNELLVFLQDPREAGTLGARLMKLEDSVFGDGK